VGEKRGRGEGRGEWKKEADKCAANVTFADEAQIICTALVRASCISLNTAGAGAAGESEVRCTCFIELRTLYIENVALNYEGSIMADNPLNDAPEISMVICTARRRR